MSKKLNELTEKTGQLDQNDLMLVSSNNVSKSVKVSTLEAPLKQYATDKADEALSTAQSEIEAEESRALAAESSLQSQISAEISSRQLAVSAEATSRSSSISAEQSRAETVEGSLQSQIDTEESRALAAESSLQSQINSILSNVDATSLDSLSEVVAAFQAADGSLQGAITSLASSSGLSSEISRAQAAESSLQSAITAETSSRNAALALKANASDVTSSLALKADSSSVYTKTESNANYEPKNSNIQAHVVSTSNPHEVTKAQVGLSNVDNTSDLNKPVSTATQTAIAAGDATTLASANTYTDNKSILSLVAGESLLVNAAVYISPASDATRTAGRAYKVNAGTASRSNCVGVVKSSTPSASPILSEDFESNSFATNGWTVASNAAGANKWEIGSFSKNSGTYGAYISNSGNTGNSYTNTSSSVSHFYRNISIPNVSGAVFLSFVYKFTGESTSSVKYDFLTIAVDPTLATPSTATISSSSSLTTPSGGLRKTYLTTSNAWTTDSVDLSAYKGQTIRLVFSWYNDNTSGTNPPVSIDSILLTEYAQIQVQTSGILSGFSGLTQGSIYYAGADGSLSTTAGSSPVPVGVAISTTELLISTSSSLSSEISRALTAEASLQSSLTTTSNLATATYDLSSAINTSLNAEITRAQAAESSLAMPPGTIITYLGTTAPSGYLACDGRSVSTTTYANLYAVITNTFGQNSVNEFNLPDFRGMFLRGAIGQGQVVATNSIAISSNNITASSSFNRTGTKVRLQSGTVTGLTTGIDYYFIYVSATTFALATTYANARAGTKIAISGTPVSAVFNSFEDPDWQGRYSQGISGSGTGMWVGSMQDDAFAAHSHYTVTTQSQINNTTVNTSFAVANDGLQGGGNYAYRLGSGSSAANAAPTNNIGGNESRPKNVYVNYYIKF